MKNSIKQLLLRSAAARRIRGWRALHRNASYCDQPATLCVPDDAKVVVLAPHMDDEVLGCGGAIAGHVLAGATVAVIFLTDGRHGCASNAALPEPERGRKQREYAQLRKEESRRAAQVLGVHTLIYLDAEDGRLHEDERAVPRLRKALESERPDVVYLPFFLERHVDHRAANDTLLAATAGGDFQFECRGYEVWTPLLANCLIDIDGAIEVKRQAMACYRSQLADMDYAHFILGLNAYRAAALSNRVRHAEAFHALPLAEYRRFHRAVCLS